MSNSLLTGKLTRLIAAEPDTRGELVAKWSQDSEFSQLFNTGIVEPRAVKPAQEWSREHWAKEQPVRYQFMIQRLEDDRIIGESGLGDTLSVHGECWFWIGIGEREMWGRGYGSDATNIILRFAFQELNMHRVTLAVFGYNTRAKRAYEKVGFVEEGRERRILNRNGRRWDGIFMGILRSEWEKKQREQ
jgi:RimJ/RimL family protein N-acetyltransferase